MCDCVGSFLKLNKIEEEYLVITHIRVRGSLISEAGIHNFISQKCYFQNSLWIFKSNGNNENHIKRFKNFYIPIYQKNQMSILHDRHFDTSIWTKAVPTGWVIYKPSASTQMIIKSMTYKLLNYYLAGKEILLNGIFLFGWRR